MHAPMQGRPPSTLHLVPVRPPVEARGSRYLRAAIVRVSIQVRLPTSLPSWAAESPRQLAGAMRFHVHRDRGGREEAWKRVFLGEGVA